jgi:hypothetical protein
MSPATVRQYTRSPYVSLESFPRIAQPVGKRGGVSKAQTVEVDGRQLSLTNLDKVLYPEAGFTKGQIIDYYVRIAPVLLPHFAGHPLTLKRYPGGVDQ